MGPLLLQESVMGAMAAYFDVLVDPAVGIISGLQEVPLSPGEPRFFHFAAQACNTGAFTENENFSRTGGASSDRITAVAKAMGEAIERYSAAIYERARLRLATADEAPFRTIPPGDFALHSAEQFAQPAFPWVPFTGDAPVRWTPVVDLATGESSNAPAAFVWIPYIYQRSAGEAPIGQPISTGLACHQDIHRARLGGLLEVVERDAFTIFWQAMCSPPQIRIETLDDTSYDLVQRFEVTGDRVVMLDITTDNGIPCLLSVLQSGHPERPALVFAAAADPDPGGAARKALEELAHTRRYSQQIRSRLPPVSNASGWEAVETQVDHLNFAADPENLPLFEFVFASRERRDFGDYASLSTGDPACDVGVCVERIAATGHRAYAAEVTSDDICSLGLGVARVLVPGYHPLFMGHSLRALGGERLYTVPQRLGHPGVARGTPGNPAPHPYP